MKGPSGPLYRLLDIIAKDEVTIHNGPMISAIAVHKPPHKKGNNRVEPGERFYELAQELGRLPKSADSKVKYEFWVSERRVVVKWARRQPHQLP